MVKKKSAKLKKLTVLTVIALALTTAVLTAVSGSWQGIVSLAAEQHYNAKSALLMDYNTGEVLFAQNPDQHLPIASMVKIMTLTLIFEEMERENLTPDTDIQVGQTAASMGGSQAFLEAGGNYKAGELVKSIIVASANDSCVAMAEHIAGSVSEFVSRMNDRVAKLGLKNTNFVNCTGLPAEGQYSCASDVAVMFRGLIEHKQFFDYSKIWLYDFLHPGGRTTTLTNTNKLVRFYEGCDGGKTGFTTEALSCLATTAKRGDTRLIAVIIAAPSAKERNAETSNLLNYGFANFQTKLVISQDSELDAQAAVEGGKEEFVKLVPEKSYYHLIKKGEKPEITHTFNVSKLNAPVKRGDIGGKIEIVVAGQKTAEINLIAVSDVKKTSYLDIINRMINKW